MKHFIFGVIILVGANSCRKFVQVEPPPNLVIDSQVFSDSAGATSAVIGLYISLAGSGRDIGPNNGFITYYTGLASDELYTSRNLVDDKLAYSNSLNPTSGVLTATWENIYSTIYKVNACIEGIEKSKGVQLTVKNQLKGECLVMRAFLYFNLINVFGPVPLITTTNFEQNSVMGRSSVDSVYDKIISDLKVAKDLLSDTYPSKGRVRVNKTAATALISRVYLYKENWIEAENAATEVINTSGIELEQDLKKVFVAESKEAIWQILPVSPGYNTGEGYFFVPGSQTVIPNAGLSNLLLQSFEDGDLRKVEGNWVRTNKVNGVEYIIPYKYKLGQDGSSSPKENYVILRKGEQYLIRSEARARQGKLTGQNSADEDLNLIRRRSGLPDTTALTTDEFLKLINHERRIELFTEGGHRWFDLKRTNHVNEVMSVVTPTKGGTWSENWKLFPVPLSELQRNPYLSQNKGYN